MDLVRTIVAYQVPPLALVVVVFGVYAYDFFRAADHPEARPEVSPATRRSTVGPLPAATVAAAEEATETVSKLARTLSH